MVNKSTSDTASERVEVATAATAVVPEVATPVAKPIAKPLAKPAVKPAAKPAVKPAVKPAAKSKTKPLPKAAVPAKVAEVPVTKVAKKPVVMAGKSVKPKKAKLVRDSFTMPEAEYSLIAEVKKRCLAKGVSVKKSEVLRAAVIGFAAQSDAAIAAVMASLTVIKTGRPPKSQK